MCARLRPIGRSLQQSERLACPARFAAVQTFKIRVINSDFESNNEIKAVSFEDARKQGLRAALTIGVDEVCGGAHFFGAEVVVDGDGDDRERFMVGMGQSPLK